MTVLLAAGSVAAADFEVGPGKTHTAIGDVPWETLAPGDRVLIHWRDTPYKEKWVIGRSGTKDKPIVVSGVPAADGKLPVIDGNGATTREALSYTNESRGVIKIGSSNVPKDTMPSHIVIENLDVRSGRPPYSFTGHGGSGDTQSYSDNAASIYIEKAQNVVIRNNILRDSGNGLFIGVFGGETQNILVEGNYIYDNGVEGSIFQHNSYTSAMGITFQYNRYGPLRKGCGGNNLKDRSAGLVIRYNWLEGGNRQLDLVDGEDHPSVPNAPNYNETFVYGNVLLEPGDDGNSQIVHYGGDSGDESIYRKGTLFFHNNTVVSRRSNNTTLLRLSTNAESADVRNNIIYVTGSGSSVAMLSNAGVLNLSNNWINSGWEKSHGSSGGTLNASNNLDTESAPGFVDQENGNFQLAAGSSCIDASVALDPTISPAHDVINQYVLHGAGQARPQVAAVDLGAFEFCESGCPQPDGGVIDPPDAGSGGSGAGAGSGGSGASAGSGASGLGGSSGSGSDNDGGCGLPHRSHVRRRPSLARGRAAGTGCGAIATSQPGEPARATSGSTPSALK